MRWIAIVFILLFLFSIVPATADPLPESNHVFINVANDAGVKYNLDGAVYGTEGNNNTYYIKADGGGLNELCITADPAVPTGQVTVSNQQSGTFYVTSSGGKGYFDDIILAVAVNGTIPDDFAVHIKSSGYNWTPSSSPSNYTYVTDVVDEVFTKKDFIYGPQVLRPCPPQKGLQPFVYGQNTSDTTNTFQFMFVDLHAGPLLSTFPDINDEGRGAVKVEYTFENLETTAAFEVYGWCLAAPQGQGISWTNDLIDQARGGSNGYSVIGIPPVLTSISVSPETAEVAQWDGMQFNATALEQRGRVMKNVTFAWSSSNETVGRMTENGYFMALSPGTATITATNGTVSGTASVTVTVPSVTMEPMSQNRHIFIKVANDDDVKYNLDGGVYGVWNNNTYYIKADGGGLNELHITADTAADHGQVTMSNNQSGVFYVSNTGGRGFDDDIVLLIAVNGTVPDDFAVHIKTSGYTWTPNPLKNQHPTSYDYVEGAVNETFTKEDFIYGPQTWKPGPGALGSVGLPLYEGQDVSDTNDTFSLMFVDLHVGNIEPSKFGGATFTDNGDAKIEYSFENLETFAAFDGYGWCLAANQAQGISWTNLPTGSGASGYSVVGIPPVLTSINVTPATTDVETGTSMQFAADALDQNDRAMSGIAFAWSSSNETVGTVNTTGYFTALAAGTTTVSAAADGVVGKATVTVTPPHGDQTENSSLNVPGCNMTTNGDGKQEVRVNTTATNATVSGNTIRIEEGTFSLNIRTEDAPTVGNGTVNGTVAGITLNTTPVTTTFDDLGTVTASLEANLTGIPAGAGLQTTVSANVSIDAQSAFQLAASKDGLNLHAVAYTMNIHKTNLTNGQDVSNATIRMTVSPAWVNAHGGVGAVRIIRWAEDGTKEVLATEQVGTDADGNLVFEAYSPNGLSVFCLAATSTPSSGSTVSSHSSSSGGSSDIAAISGSIPAGETQSFAVTKTAITSITVDAYDAIDDMLVTVQKAASLPDDVSAPTQTTFQVIETTLYRVDPSALNGVTLEFAVPTSWLEDHGLTTDNIVLLGYEKNGWKTLTTTFLKEENGQALYSAEASGFSYFAIVTGTTTSAGQQVTETSTPVTTLTETATTTAPATTPTTQKSPLFWALPLIAFGVLFLLRKRD